jgi:hypothetical protein
VRCASAQGVLFRVQKTDFFNTIKTSETTHNILRQLSIERDEEINARCHAMKHVHGQIFESYRKKVI